MSTITTDDGTEIFYEDRGSGRPSSADDRDAQQMFFLQHGQPVVVHDRTRRSRARR